MSRDSGFVLSDVLVGLLLASLMGSLLLRLNHQASVQLQVAESQLVAAMLLRDRSVGSQDQSSGTYTYRGQSFDWSVRTVSSEALRENGAVLEARLVRIEWTVGSHPRHIESTTHRIVSP